MNKKRTFQISVIIISLLIFQFIYFNYISTSNIGKLQKQEAEIHSLRETISQLSSQLEDAPKKSYVSSHKIPETIVFCGDTLDVENQHIREKIEREFYSLLGKQGQVHLYLKRSKKYTFMIENHLKKAGLPTDLKYLAMHESALLPKIRSRSNAVGLWQFMRSTGRLYGLKINRYIDERRDPEKSTKSAIRFIKELYRYYDNWPMVMAAYNGGHGRVSRATKRENSRSFFDLSLPEETERYYFKIIATKILLENPENYGFIIQDKDFFKPVPTIAINLSIDSNQMSIDEISSQCQLSIAEFKFLNPKIIGLFLPRGSYEINLSLEKSKLLAAKKSEGEIDLRLTTDSDGESEETPVGN